ncbi:MAG TPA: trypsin-like peptidase domain-containing protein [Jatrophihabitans sp.]|uniref:S1C family serine protease n=1 Tax=Jatrophihabitans sp. TaxID=1932789 RepID=UPI002EDBEB7E
MSDQSTPEQAGHASAPSEQPYHVPTAHQQAWSAAQHYPGQPYWSPPPVPDKPRSHRLLIGSVAAATVAALAVGGIAVAERSGPESSEQATVTSPNSPNPFGDGQASPYGNGSNGNGDDSNGDGSDGNGSNGGDSSTARTTGPATAAQQIGVVNISTTVNYGQGKAAGTGIVLSPDGEILTNNHVIEDSTAITVTVVSTGKSYTATVVGTAPSQDVSVLQLKGASGLATAKLGDSGKVEVGDAVTAVGNAGGTGGTPTAATGTVTALNQSITASDSDGSDIERLTGMIQVDADIEAGDSGGPLYDNATGSVIGIDTAASSASARFGGATTGFAIPIAKALGIADEIESGQESSTVNIGYPAFLGVQLSPTGSSSQEAVGARISGVVPGSAAAEAGLRAGEAITAVDGTAITSASGLSSVLEAHQPGDEVRLRYTDSAGQSRSVSVRLGAGPAD